jgi:hypothetical protein
MALGISLFGMFSPAFSAIVLTFDDAITEPAGPIFDGYGGFDWVNFDAIDTVAFGGDTWSGYYFGRLSGTYVAMNPAGDPAMLSSDDSFDFIGAYLTAFWRLGLNVDVEGYHGDTLLYSETVVVDHTSPTWFEFDFMNIDKLRFESYGGTNPSGGIDVFQFAMDDLTYVPEPTTLLLLGLGAAMVKRKR